MKERLVVAVQGGGMSFIEKLRMLNKNNISVDEKIEKELTPRYFLNRFKKDR